MKSLQVYCGHIPYDKTENGKRKGVVIENDRHKKSRRRGGKTQKA